MGKTFRVVVCGTKFCGKTSIIEKAIYNKSGVSMFILIWGHTSPPPPAFVDYFTK